MADIRAVAFDCYGTVIDFNQPDFIATMAEICDRQRLDADAADLWRRFLRAALAFRAENHERPVYSRYDEAWARQFEHVFKRLRLEGDPWQAALYLKEKLATAPAYPEARDILDALRSRYRVALLSNADDDFLLACLERNSLHFDTVVSSERAGAIKPDPAIFRHLASSLALTPSSILYVGDNPVPDLLGGRQAGLKVAWVNRFRLRRPRRVPPPDVKVASLQELLPLLCGSGVGQEPQP
ncbi:MAG: HAD family hydrolase [Chloroflexi bacterium]|nr:HAD family hydrolase [Chloroflexota bacterium]